MITLLPNGTGTNVWNIIGAATAHEAVDEGVSTSDDSITTIQITNVIGLGNSFLSLQDVPSDFISATAVNVLLRTIAVIGIPAPSLEVSISESNESTAITSTSTVSLTSSWNTTNVSLSVTGNNDKTTWNGAKIKLRGNATLTSVVSVSAIEAVLSLLWEEIPSNGVFLNGISLANIVTTITPSSGSVVIGGRASISTPNSSTNLFLRSAYYKFLRNWRIENLAWKWQWTWK